jgi:hypothetical protein
MGWLSDLFGGGAARDARRQAQAAEQAERERVDRIARGRADIDRIFGSTFTPEFYSGIGKAYEGWAMPQVDRQAKDVRQNMSFALARAGTTRSSAAAQGKADLQENYDLKRQDIAKQGLDLQNQRRVDVENNRQSIESQLFATADPAAAATSAANTASAISQQPAYNPLGQLLVDTSNLYGRAQQAGADPLAYLGGRQATGGTGGRSRSGFRVGG